MCSCHVVHVVSIILDCNVSGLMKCVAWKGKTVRGHGHEMEKKKRQILIKEGNMRKNYFFISSPRPKGKNRNTTLRQR